MRTWSILALAVGLLVPVAIYVLLPPALGLFILLVIVVGSSMCAGRRDRLREPPAR